MIVFFVLIASFLGGGYLVFKKNIFLSLQHSRSFKKLWDEQRTADVLDMGERILASDPLNRVALAFSGFAAYMSGRYHPDEEKSSRYIIKAIQYLRRLRTIDSLAYTAEVEYVLGKSYYAIGRQQESLYHLKEAYRKGIRVVDIYEYLAVLYEHFQDYEAATTILTEANEYVKNKELYYPILARIYMKQKKYSDAREVLTFLIRSSKKARVVEESKVYMAQLLYEEDKITQVLALLKDLIKEYPKNDTLRILLGDVFSRQGEKERARYEWREAVRLNPFNAAAVKRLTE